VNTSALVRILIVTTGLLYLCIGLKKLKEIMKIMKAVKPLAPCGPFPLSLGRLETSSVGEAASRQGASILGKRRSSQSCKTAPIRRNVIGQTQGGLINEMQCYRIKMSAQTKVEVTRGVFDPRTYKQEDKQNWARKRKPEWMVSIITSYVFHILTLDICEYSTNILFVYVKKYHRRWR